MFYYIFYSFLTMTSGQFCDSKVSAINTSQAYENCTNLAVEYEAPASNTSFNSSDSNWNHIHIQYISLSSVGDYFTTTDSAHDDTSTTCNEQAKINNGIFKRNKGLISFAIGCFVGGLAYEWDSRKSKRRKQGNSIEEFPIQAIIYQEMLDNQKENWLNYPNIEKVHEELEKVKKEKEKIHKLYSRIIEAHRKFKNEHTKLENNHAKLENSHKKFKNQHAKLKNNHTKLKNEYNQYKTQHSLSIQKVTKDFEKHKNLNDFLKLKNSEYLKKMENLTTENMQLAKKSDEIEKKLFNIEKKNKVLNKIDGKYKKLINTHQKLTDEHDKQKEENVHLIRENKKLNHSLTSTLKELNKLKKKLATAEEEYQLLQGHAVDSLLLWAEQQHLTSQVMHMHTNFSQFRLANSMIPNNLAQAGLYRPNDWLLGESNSIIQVNVDQRIFNNNHHHAQLPPPVPSNINSVNQQ